MRYACMPVDADVIEKRVGEIRWAINELKRLASKEFAALSVDQKYAIRYNIIVLVESLVSLCLHIAHEDLGGRPATYKEAVRVAAERVGVTCVRELESLVGLRNLLIHRYWNVEDEKIHWRLRADFECVEELIAKMEETFRS